MRSSTFTIFIMYCRITPFKRPLDTGGVTILSFEIDWNAGRLVEDKKMDEYAEEFFKYILDVASDRKKTKNEINGYREIAIFKNGVTL